MSPSVASHICRWGRKDSTDLSVTRMNIMWSKHLGIYIPLSFDSVWTFISLSNFAVSMSIYSFLFLLNLCACACPHMSTYISVLICPAMSHQPNRLGKLAEQVTGGQKLLLLAGLLLAVSVRVCHCGASVCACVHDFKTRFTPID